MRFSRAAPDEGRRESQSGLARRLYVVCPELSDVRVRIASVGERFGRFLVEQVQTHKRRRANKQSQRAKEGAAFAAYARCWADVRWMSERVCG